MKPSSAKKFTITPELAQKIENVETQLWKTLWASIPKADAASLGMHHEIVGSAVAIVCDKVPDWFFNRVIGLGVNQPATRDDINHLINCYRSKQLPMGISLSPFAKPESLRSELEMMGFRNQLDWAKMIRGTEPTPPVKTDLRVEKVTPAQHDIALDVMIQGFGLPDMMRPMFKPALTASTNTAFMMWDGDQPAAIGIITILGDAGHLNSACTLPQYRSRGAQGALMAQRIKHGVEQGCRLFFTETGIIPNQKNTSLDNMYRMGFELAYARPNYVLSS